MGNAIRIILKPLKDWNIENRAIRAISKDKLVAAPKYKSDEISLANVLRGIHRTLLLMPLKIINAY